MKPESVAAALVAGQTPDIPDMTAYWLATDAGTRPKPETVAVLAALSATPPDPARIESFVRYADHSHPPVRLHESDRAVNIVGTGGGQPTFNISTTAGFVAAAAGAKVLKSGSSAYSSAVGSADILSALGVSRAMPLTALDDMLGQIGIAFAPASAYAPICRRLAIAAQPLPFKMIGRFVNALGPLICPFQVAGSVVGASTPQGFDSLHQVAGHLGKRLLLVHSELGVDELISVGTNRIGWSGQMATQALNCGPVTGDITGLRGGDLADNLRILLDVLAGTAPQIQLETVALNAGAVLHVAGLAPDIIAGSHLALSAIRDGAALDKLRQAQDFVAKMSPQTTIRAAEAAE